MLAGVLLALVLPAGCQAAERTGKMNQETMKQERPQIRITTVRYDEMHGRAQLRNYIFGGIRSVPRVPRGIEPELVSRFIIDEIEPDSPPDAYAKTVQVLRFYERADCLPHLRRILTGKEKTSADLLRSAFVAQAMAEVGTPEEAQEAARYFDAHLAGHSKAMEAMDVLLETLVVLTPAGSADRLSQRIAEEVQARQAQENESEEGMRAFQRVAAIQRLKLPQALAAAEGKRKVLALQGGEQLAELVAIYMGASGLSDELMMTWAARMLRRQAMTGDPAPIYTALAAEINKADPAKVGKDALTDTMVSRAAQAILYLQGTLDKKQRALYDKTRLGAMNYLWDDLP
ncbi:MAG: hypothetical protein C4531_06765 [Desulfurivibrio sp.]|nr:MAG: hypothetical protein C4531_06765 [Desulfurivibrio sp.]